MARIDGTVSFHTADQNTWSAATLNYPITSGNALWADNASHAIVDVGGNAINLGSMTELDVDQLDDQNFQASVPQGSVYLNLPRFNNGDSYQIATPRGTVTINQPGRYQVITGDQSNPGQVIVYSGAAQVTGDNLSMTVQPGQMAVLSDNGQGGAVQATLAAAPPEDSLAVWARSQEPRAAPPAPAVAMTGAQDLGNYGQWATTPDYGDVWYPQVDPDWAPYREGHWAWVAPWGWTWIDDAPWGFAPFHYGRWVRIGPRWAWAPRPIVVVAEPVPVVPVYAPALVSFFGDVGGIGVSIGIGAAVGWVPLGPSEVYYPSYRCSPRYAREVNVTYVKNVNVININNTTVINNRNVNINNFRNHDSMTVVPRDAMVNSRHIPNEMKRVNAQDFQHMRGLGAGQPPVKPTAATAGLTPREAKRFGVAANEIHRQPAAGPQIREGSQKMNWSQNNRAIPQLNGNRQPVGNEMQGNNSKWQNGGSRKPGAAVQQPGLNNAQNNGRQVVPTNQRDNTQRPGNQPAANENQATQGHTKWNWSNNNQSHQPGAPVQPRQNGWQQGNWKPHNGQQLQNGQARTTGQPQNQAHQNNQQPLTNGNRNQAGQQFQQQKQSQQERAQQQMQQQKKQSQQERAQQQMQQQERAQQQMQQQQRAQQQMQQQERLQQQMQQQQRAQQQMQQQERAQQQMQQQERVQQQMQQQERVQQQMQQQERVQQYENQRNTVSRPESHGNQRGNPLQQQQQ